MRTRSKLVVLSFCLVCLSAYDFPLRTEEIYYSHSLLLSVLLSVSSTSRVYTGSRMLPMSDMVISCKRENALRRR